MNFNNHLPAPKCFFHFFSLFHFFLYSDVDISPYPEFESPIQKKIKYSPLASREGIETLANNEKEDIKAPTEHRFISQNEKINLNNNQTTRIDIKSMDHLISRRQSRVSSEKRKSLLITNMNDGPGEMIEIDIFKTFDYPQNNCKQTMETFLTSLFFQILINVFTVWCLFADDFKIIFVPKVPGDTVFDIINSICLLVFIFEIILASITRKQYILSFYFFMDFVSTGIIIFDLTWVQEAMMYIYICMNVK